MTHHRAAAERREEELEDEVEAARSDGTRAVREVQRLREQLSAARDGSRVEELERRLEQADADLTELGAWPSVQRACLALFQCSLAAQANGTLVESVAALRRENEELRVDRADYQRAVDEQVRACALWRHVANA